MKKYFFLFALIIGLLACSTAPPPDDVGTTYQVETIVPDNGAEFSEIILTSNLSQEQVLHFDAGDFFTFQFVADTVIYVDELDAHSNRYFASIATGNNWQDNIEPPNSDVNDVMTIPKKDDPWQNWLKWGIGLVVLVLYNVIQKRRQTAKSWTVLGMLYRFFNSIQKDKTFNGNLEIKRE